MSMPNSGSRRRRRPRKCSRLRPRSSVARRPDPQPRPMPVARASRTILALSRGPLISAAVAAAYLHWRNDRPPMGDLEVMKRSPVSHGVGLSPIVPKARFRLRSPLGQTPGQGIGIRRNGPWLPSGVARVEPRLAAGRGSSALVRRTFGIVRGPTEKCRTAVVWLFQMASGSWHWANIGEGTN